MANNTKLKDITDFDRTVNYIQFQISQTEQALEKFHGTNAKPIMFAYLIEAKKSLQNELHALRKANRRSK